MVTARTARMRIWAIVVGCAGVIGLINPVSAEAAPRARARVAAGPIYSGAHLYLAPSAIYIAPYRVAPRPVVVVPSPWYAVPPVRVYREPLYYPNAIWGPPQGPTVYGYPGNASPGQPTLAVPPQPEAEPVPVPPALPEPAEPPVEPGDGSGLPLPVMPPPVQ